MKIEVKKCLLIEEPIENVEQETVAEVGRAELIVDKDSGVASRARQVLELPLDEVGGVVGEGDEAREEGRGGDDGGRGRPEGGETGLHQAHKVQDFGLGGGKERARKGGERG